MVVLNQENILGLGIYTEQQAAHLARVQPKVLHRWIYGDKSGDPALISRFDGKDQRIISFVDFVQTLAVREIRKDKRLSLNKIRETILRASEHGIQFPFARRHQTYLFEDDVVIKLPSDDLIQVTGKYKEQQLIRPVVELYLDDLGFDETGLANRYTPLKENDREIVLDPAQRFGAPIVLPCNYTVDALVQAVESEGSVDNAADAFGVTQEDIKIALKYEDILAGIAA